MCRMGVAVCLESPASGGGAVECTLGRCIHVSHCVLLGDGRTVAISQLAPEGYMGRYAHECHNTTPVGRETADQEYGPYRE